MSELEAQFATLKKIADPAVADAIAKLVKNGEDHELNRVNVLDFSRQNGFDEERAISGFLHASRLGLFALTWNVRYPGCSGVLDAYDTLKSLRNEDYHCGLCDCRSNPEQNTMIEWLWNEIVPSKSKLLPPIGARNALGNILPG